MRDATLTDARRRRASEQAIRRASERASASKSELTSRESSYASYTIQVRRTRLIARECRTRREEEEKEEEEKRAGSEHPERAEEYTPADMENRPAPLRSRRVCRFCLTESEPLTFIYERDHNKPFQVPLTLQIMSCVAIEVSGPRRRWLSSSLTMRRYNLLVSRWRHRPPRSVRIASCRERAPRYRASLPIFGGFR